MIPEYIVIIAVIAALSVVQSIFGMGVLVFGTPTLLLMGYDFLTTLGFLLPASFAISVLQVLAAGSNRGRVSPYLYLLCVPGIGGGLLIVEFSPLAPWINIPIGGILILSALVRFWSPSQNFLTSLLERYLPLYHLIMGTIHGLTNLGGVMLAILASGTNTEKEAIRYTVAHYYLVFSAIQMLMLATIMGHHDLLLANLPIAGISATVYILIGNRIFNRANNASYNHAMTLFIAAYGVVVLFKN